MVVSTYETFILWLKFDFLSHIFVTGSKVYPAAGRALVCPGLQPPMVKHAYMYFVHCFETTHSISYCFKIVWNYSLKVVEMSTEESTSSSNDVDTSGSHESTPSNWKQQLATKFNLL